MKFPCEYCGSPCELSMPQFTSGFPPCCVECRWIPLTVILCFVAICIGIVAAVLAGVL